MAEEAALGALFSGLAKGISSGVSIGTAYQLQQNREQQMNLDQNTQALKMMDLVRQDPAYRPVAEDFMAKIGVPKERIKSQLDIVQKSSEDNYANLKDLFLKNMVDPKGLNFREIAKMSLTDQYKLIEEARKVQGGTASAQALRDVGGGGPGMGGDPSAPPMAVTPPMPGAPATAAPLPVAGGPQPAAAPITDAPPAATPAPPAASPASAGLPFTSGIGKATQDLGLNEQERALYTRHLGNLADGKRVDNQDGSTSTLRVVTADDENGRTRVIPTVWDGKVHTPQEAIDHARAEGMEKFPGYDSPEAAKNRYDKMHTYMDSDVQKFTQTRTASGTPGPAATPTAVPAAAPQPVAVPGPGGTSITAPPSAQSAPAFRNAAQAARYNLAADRVEKLGYADEAEKLRTKAKALEGNAYVTLDPATTKKMGFRSGAIINYNLINNDMKVVQAGEDTKSVIPFDNPIYKRLKPGAIAVRSSNGGLEISYQGEDKFTPVSAADKKKLGIDDNMLAMQSTSGNIALQRGSEDKFTPITDEDRSGLKEMGVHLDPSQPYEINRTTKAIRPIGPGITTERETDRLGASSNQKKMDALRAEGESATESLRLSQVTRGLLDRFSTGPTAPARILGGQILNELGYKDGAKKLGTAEGEALVSRFNDDVLSKGHVLPGSASDADVHLIQRTTGGLLTTKDGNLLIRDIADWSSKVKQDRVDTAETWNNQFGGLHKVDPATGKNWYQTHDKTVTPLPPELKDRLKAVEADTPKPGKIRQWNFPISEANEAQLRLLAKNRDKLTMPELSRLEARIKELNIQD